MYQMKTATVRDLRYRFPEVEARLREGAEIQVTKSKQVIARRVPVRPQRPRRYPDFLAIQKEIFGNRVLKVSGAEVVPWARGEY